MPLAFKQKVMEIFSEHSVLQECAVFQKRFAIAYGAAAHSANSVCAIDGRCRFLGHSKFPINIL